MQLENLLNVLKNDWNKRMNKIGTSSNTLNSIDYNTKLLLQF